MTSKKIVLNDFNKVKLNHFYTNKKNIKKKIFIIEEKYKEILKDYFKNNYENIKKFNFIETLINKYINKIQKINYFKNSVKYNKYKFNLKYVFNKLIAPFVVENIFTYNANEINDRYDKFFNLQTTLISKHIFSLINYQYIFITCFESYINILVSLKTYFIHSEIDDFNYKKKEDKNIKKFVTEYINDFNIQKLPSKNKIKKENLSPEKETILLMLKNICQNIIKKILKLSNDEDFKSNIKNLIIYGSYTSHLINVEVSYNDIDLYHANPLKFLSLLCTLFHILLDIEVNIFRIPYILGHLSLTYEKQHFIDCIYLDKYTIDNIPSIKVKNINIIDPIVQMFNNFRMLSEIFRLSNLTENKEDNILKYSVLLEKSNERLNIDYENLYKIKHPLKFEIIDNSFILINLQAGFQEFNEYKELKNIKKFDYLIISFTEPKILLKILKNRNDLRISKQYFALFNEICIEFENKEKANILKKQNINLNNKINIQESDILILTKENIYQIPTELNEIINNNNVLLMTNISTNLYIKNCVTKEKICENFTVSNISKETILSSFILYNLLKKNDENLNKFYIKYFLSFLKTNKKNDEFKLLNNPCESEKIIKHPKIKICGYHETFSIKHLTFKNVFFFNIQDKDYYDYDEFLIITNYNENLKIK